MQNTKKKAQTFCVTFWVTFLKNNCLDAWNPHVLRLISASLFFFLNKIIKYPIGLVRGLTKTHISNCLCLPVLSIHKRPTSTSSNFTFPVKGWRGMLDWVRTSEEKISVSREALSLKQSGKNIQPWDFSKKDGQMCALTQLDLSKYSAYRWKWRLCDRNRPLQKPRLYHALPKVRQWDSPSSKYSL